MFDPEPSPRPDLRDFRAGFPGTDFRGQWGDFPGTVYLFSRVPHVMAGRVPAIHAETAPTGQGDAAGNLLRGSPGQARG